MTVKSFWSNKIATSWRKQTGWVAALLIATGLRADEARIQVRADHILGPVSRYLTGACLEDVNHEVYGGLYSQMIFGESFQEPPPPPALKGFTAYAGGWSIRDGVVSIPGGAGPKLVSERPPFKDGAVQVEMLFANSQGGNAGVIARVSQAGPGADNFIGYEVALDAARQTLRLARHRHNFELIKDIECNVAVGRWIALEARLAGSVIEVLVDGRTALRHDDGPNALPAGAVGLRAWQREASFRDLRVAADGRRERLAFAPVAEPPALSAMWRAVRCGNAAGHFAIVTERPFAGRQSQAVGFDSGEGEWGLENQGLNRWGMSFVRGGRLEGRLWARAAKPTTVFAALENRDGSRVYAETRLVVASADWRPFDFTLTPNGADSTGRFALKLKQPGSLVLGHVFLEPGGWGRFKGLPVRRDVAEALVAQGLTVLRYGGSMVNHPAYRWKNMIGPRDRRPPYGGFWYPHASNGWGILDFMDFCEAAGFEYVPAFHLGETPQDMADFIEYAKGPARSEWGARRVAADHRRPYRLRYLELGNEERVDEEYAAAFEALALAIWAKDPDIILVVGDFAYEQRIADPFNFRGAASGITNLAGQQRILRLAKQHGREVWFDVHVGTEHPPLDPSFAGLFSFVDALKQLADGARHRVAVFEFNAGNHAQKRGLANALAIHALERDGRIPIATSANCLQPDGQNDNGWDQGLLFLSPSRVWLQPPGYVTRMIAQNRLPHLVACEVSGAETGLDANAKRSTDGRTLVVQVVNPGDQPVLTRIELAGFTPRQPSALVTELAGPLDAVNSADHPNAITPQRRRWRHTLKQGATSRVFPPHSFTILRFE